MHRLHRQGRAAEAAAGERRKGGRAESEAERRHRLHVLSTPVAIIEYDQEFRVTAWNPAAEAIFGWPQEEALGQYLDFIVPESAREHVGRILRQLLSGESAARRNENENVRKDGRIITCDWNNSALFSASGDIVGIASMALDVTDRKRAEEALQRSENRFRALIENSSDLIVVLDADARYQFWSPSATEALGWTAAECLGRSTFEFIHPEDQARAGGVFASLFATEGATERVLLRYRHKDGSWRQVEATGRNLLGDPNVRGIVVNSRDVTVQRSLEEQLQQAQRLESVGRLAGGIAHDFNNLLTVILSCTEALRDDVAAGGPPQLDVLEEVYAAGQRAAELTRQLLAFARKQVIAPVPLDLNAVVRGSEKLLRRVLGEDVALAVALEPALWTVRCDPGQIEQVVLNLAINARDAMPGGGRLTLSTGNVEVDEALVAAHPFLRAGPHVRLTLRDTGHGMSPHVMKHLFEPFFTTKPKGRGTGLGLATVYGIVKQSGGAILVDSAEGEGTAFDLYFPRTLEAPQPVAAPPATARARGSETVLVVEDDRQVRDVTVRSLRAGGYDVLTAGDGAEALATAGNGEHVDLLVTDVVMPGANGFSVAEALRRRQPGLRVLYVSGYARDAVAEHGVLAPGTELLQKPFTAASLLARVRAVLDAP